MTTFSMAFGYGPEHFFKSPSDGGLLHSDGVWAVPGACSRGVALMGRKLVL
jgi:hypothetical protein